MSNKCSVCVYGTEGEEKCSRRFGWETPNEKYNSGDLSVDERLARKLILRKQSERAWTGLIWLRTGTVVGLL